MQAWFVWLLRVTINCKNLVRSYWQVPYACLLLLPLDSPAPLYLHSPGFNFWLGCMYFWTFLFSVCVIYRILCALLCCSLHFWFKGSLCLWSQWSSKGIQVSKSYYNMCLWCSVWCRSHTQFSLASLAWSNVRSIGARKKLGAMLVHGLFQENSWIFAWLVMPNLTIFTFKNHYHNHTISSQFITNSSQNLS